jgi:sterol desaturase/sphingolipid hydroxylase (fatty acid hydroxylase superfamily)
VTSLGAVAVFPVVMGGAVGLMIWLLGRGVAPAFALVVTDTAALACVAVAERLLPFRRHWNRDHGDTATDAAHALVSGLGGQQALKPLLDAAGVIGAGWIARTLGAGAWPADWPLAAQLGLAMLIAELGTYWTHRAQHRWEPLWRFHAVHHSAPRLYWLNAARFHPGDLCLLFASWYLPLAVLGCPEPVLALTAMFDTVLGLLQHSNIDVRLGWLNRVFSMAEPHRWHHSRTLAEANTNYGSNLSVWDVAFGTFHLPAGRLPPADVGLADMPSFPAGWAAQIAAPFRWRALQRAARGGEPAVGRSRRAAPSGPAASAG